MRSEPSQRRWYDHPAIAALGSVRVSVVLGFATAAMLGFSSFFVPNPRGPGALPFNESIAPFFDPVAPKFLWFYALLAVTFAYGVNGLFGTVRNLAQRYAAGTVDLRFSGIFLMHSGFVLALIAHLIAGFGTEVEGRYLLSHAPTEIAGRTVVLRDALEILHPDGSLRTFTSTLDFGGGDLRTLGYNAPVFFDGFRRWILVEGPEQVPGGAPEFTVDSTPATVDAHGGIGVGAVRYTVVRVSQHRSLNAPMVQVEPVGGGPATWLGPGFTTDDGLRFEGLGDELGVSVVVRRNDGLPLVLVATAVFAAGLALFAADAWRRRG